tara:strand:+ start:268053 stop:269441 length:1389 start_codon:yes stop_codon:yes gene_type:complete
LKKALSVLVLYCLLACQSKKDPVDYVIISGKISNLDSKEVSLTAINGEFKKQIPVEDNGIFRDTLRLFPKVPYVLSDGTHFIDLYFENGYDLILTYDAKHYENTLKFRGTGSALNEYFHVKQKKTIEIWGGDAEKVYSLKEPEFIAKMQGLSNALKELLKNTDSIPEEIRKKESRNIDYERLIIYSSYLDSAHAEFTNNSNFKASEKITGPLDSLAYDIEEDFNYSKRYRSLARRYYANKAEELSKKDSVAYNTAFLETMKNISIDNIRNALLFNGVKYSLPYSKNMDADYQSFMEISTSTYHKKEITASFNKLKMLASGEVSPVFTDLENHAGGTASLSDFKGKYVYIDVWATWCAPCIAEIPALKEMEELYSGKNIAFLSISIDNKKQYQAWRDMVTEKALGGIQLIAENAWESKFVQAYQIMGIPRFILIDPEGKIVNAKAPAPSNVGLKPLLNELLDI